MNNTENSNNLPTEKENSSPNLNVNSDNESDNIFERAINKASICIKYGFRWAYYTYIVKVDPKEKEAVEEILKELEEQNNKEKAIKITEDKIVNLHNELENVEINTQGNIGIKEKELKSKLEEKEELEKKLQEEYSGFASLFKGRFGQSKEKKEKLQKEIDKKAQEIKSLEREIEVRKKICRKKKNKK